MIRLDNIQKEYKTEGVPQLVLSNINLRIKANEFITIVGKSGSGKTTLINLIGLLENPTSGAIYYEGKKVNHKKEKEIEELRSEYISYVFQNPNLISSLNPIDNIVLGINEKKSMRVKREMAYQALESVGLIDKAKSNISTLSGGEQQRISIARALVNSPKVLICDEPTGSLDPKIGKTIMGLLEQILKDKERALIVVTHDQELASHGDRKLEILEGEIHEI